MSLHKSQAVFDGYNGYKIPLALPAPKPVPLLQPPPESEEALQMIYVLMLLGINCRGPYGMLDGCSAR